MNYIRDCFMAEYGLLTWKPGFKPVFATILIKIMLLISGPGFSRVKSFTFRSGLFNYQQSGIVSQSGSGARYLNFEWCYFNTFYDGTILSYKRVVDDTDRTLYQAFSTGMRYFPLNAGYSTEYLTDQETISYDMGHSFYLDGGVSLGRYLISVFGNPPIYDLSSDFLGLSLGAGWIYQVTSNVSFDLHFNFGYVFGFNSPVAFNATDTSLLLGISVTYGNQRFSPT